MCINAIYGIRLVSTITNLVREHVYVVKEPVNQFVAKLVHNSIPQDDCSPSQNIGRLLF